MSMLHLFIFLLLEAACCDGFLLTPSPNNHNNVIRGKVPSSSFPSSGRHCNSKSLLIQQAEVDNSKSTATDGVVFDPLEHPSLILDDVEPEFQTLFTQAALTTSKGRAAVTTEQAHDPFRYEWGTWVDEVQIRALMDRVDEVRLVAGAYDELLKLGNGKGEGKGKGKGERTLRFKVASGTDWDCLLHVLPTDTQFEGRWCTGSWTILKALTGVAEISMLRENRDGGYKKAIKKDLRGGTDGTFGGGAAMGGADCIKYVGGPLRSYMGKSGNTVLLEVCVRPPISGVDNDNVGIPELSNIGDFLSIELPAPEEDDDDDNNAEDEDSKMETTAQEQAQSLGDKLGMTFEKVGGLDKQLDAIVRRVLASRANPEAARRLGMTSHVRGILLSGPPGCGKTLLARELARLLGARAPQIVNGPEILDKFIGEAEKRVRDLFAPAEMEYAQVGDDSALHIIILDEMDAIAKKRGTVSSDSTGVRDSVVNQLLAKMDGVKEANNVLVVGLTNRPELLDPALLRPGRLEVQLRVELPDLKGRRDIFRIHTRQMREGGGLSEAAEQSLEDLGDDGLPAKTDHFTGAEIAGLIRSAASFALARSIDSDGTASEESKVSVDDLELALTEVRPALGKQDEALKMRFPLGISPWSSSMKRVIRDLERFITPPVVCDSPRLQSLLLVGGGGGGGSGASALSAWTAAQASKTSADYVRFITALDLLSGDGSNPAAALIDRFSEAKEMPNSLLVLDDVDQICAGNGPNGYSSTMIATLRALLRTPPDSSSTAKAGGQSTSTRAGGRTFHVIATTSRSDAACVTLHELFEETIVIPLLSDVGEVLKLIEDSNIPGMKEAEPMAKLIVDRIGSVGCKTVLRLVERAVSISVMTSDTEESQGKLQLVILEEMLDDLVTEQAVSGAMCRV